MPRAGIVGLGRKHLINKRAGLLLARKRGVVNDRANGDQREGVE